MSLLRHFFAIGLGIAVYCGLSICTHAQPFNPTNTASGYLVTMEVSGAPYLNGQVDIVLLVQPPPPAALSVGLTVRSSTGETLLTQTLPMEPGGYPQYRFSFSHPDLNGGGSLVLSTIATNKLAARFWGDATIPIPPKAALFFEGEATTVDDELNARIAIGMTSYLPRPVTLTLEERAESEPGTVLRSRDAVIPAGGTRLLVDWTNARPNTFFTIKPVETAVDSARASNRIVYPPAVIGFSDASQTSAAGGAITVVVSRKGPLVADASVEYEVIAGTATADHLVRTNGVVRFAEKQRAALIYIQTLDAPTAPNKTFTVVLRDPVGAVLAEDRKSIEVTLANSVRLDRDEYIVGPDERLQGKVLTIAPMSQDTAVTLFLPGGFVPLLLKKGESEVSFDLWFPLVGALWVRLEAPDILTIKREEARVRRSDSLPESALITLQGGSVKEGDTLAVPVSTVANLEDELEMIVRWSGSPIAGLDYEPLSTSVRIKTTNDAPSISFRALPRQGFQPQRQLRIELVSAKAPERVITSADCTIEEASLIRLEISASDEGDSATVHVLFTGAPQRFRYYTRDLEARAMIDYIPISGEHLDSSTPTDLAVPLPDNGILQADRSFELVVESLDVPGLSSTLPITIQDNELPLPPLTTLLPDDLAASIGTLQRDDSVILITTRGACYHLDSTRHLTMVRPAQLTNSTFDSRIAARYTNGDLLLFERREMSNVLRRVRIDGTLEPAFSVPLDPPLIAALAVDKQDRIYVGVSTYASRGAVMRLTPEGSVDPTFRTFYPLVGYPSQIWPGSDFIEIETAILFGGWGGLVQSFLYRLAFADGTLLATNSPPNGERKFVFDDGSLLMTGLKTHRVERSGQVRQNFVADPIYGTVIGINSRGNLVVLEDQNVLEIPLITDPQATTYDFYPALALEENHGPTSYAIQRRGNTARETRLRVGSTDISAVRGHDYLADEWLTFPELSHTASLTVRPIDNLNWSENRQYQLSFSDVSSGAVFGETVVTILENDPKVRLVVQRLGPATQIVFENPSPNPGVLQSASNLGGPWERIPTIAPAWENTTVQIDLGEQHRFYRVTFPPSR